MTSQKMLNSLGSYHRVYSDLRRGEDPMTAQPKKKSLFLRREDCALGINKENNSVNNEQSAKINRILFEIDQEDARKYTASAGRQLEELGCLKIPQKVAQSGRKVVCRHH